MNAKQDFEMVRIDILGRAIRKRWLLYSSLILISVGLGIARFYLTDPVYKASAILIPNFSQESKMSKLASIANKFGVESPVPGANMVDYLEQIIVSRTVLIKLMNNRFCTAKNDTSTLFELYKPKKSLSPILDTLIYLKKLRDRISFEKGSSGLVQINVLAASPKMAMGIANQLAGEIDRFVREKNLESLKNQISYLTEQVAVIEAERNSNNHKMLEFLKKNRGIEPSLSPTLFSEYSELKLQLDITNQSYLLLRQELEQARISIFKKEPLLMFIDPAEEPYWKWAPKGKVLVIIHFVIGIALAALIHFILHIRTSAPIKE